METPEQNLEKMAALGRITRSLIHDFNNSLASIMGHADFLIADLPADSEQHLFAKNIKRAGLQLQSSLEQIKSFARDNKNAEPVAATEFEPFPTPIITPHKSRSILLVEDRVPVLQAIAVMLRRDHHQVESVTDGFDALDMIRENPKKYDLLITDYCMPELNGKDLLKELRQDFKSLPVIVMSGDKELLIDLMNDKTNRHTLVVSKPIIADDLKRAIEATNHYLK
jgi:two-component system chemotaxis response regulator CheY